MNILTLLVILSSLSFLIYGVSYFTSPHMRSEFQRFQLEKWGLWVVILEILGALGLLLGLAFNVLLIISSGGLSLLMLMGVAVRLKIGDSILEILPALFFMLLNTYIFIEALN
jgi:hypothetical protein